MHGALWRDHALEWERAKVVRIEDQMATVRQELQRLQRQKRLVVNRACSRRCYRMRRK